MNNEQSEQTIITCTSPWLGRLATAPGEPPPGSADDTTSITWRGRAAVTWSSHRRDLSEFISDSHPPERRQTGKVRG
jgi:hypothetical protein